MSIEFFHPDGSPSATSIHFFPGGEPRLEIDAPAGSEAIAFIRGADATDLIILAIWANSVRRMSALPIVFLPYLPGARADHGEHAAGFDAAAYASLLNAAHVDHLYCVDPHSVVMPALLKRCVVVEVADLIAHEL